VKRRDYGMGLEVMDGASGIEGQPPLQMMGSTSITRAVWPLFHAW
jgi:hypothetical protein